MMTFSAQTSLASTFWVVVCLSVAANAGKEPNEATTYTDYCILGAGPGGLQLAYFLANSNRSYVVLEKEAVAGSFFVDYPRMRRLISINKRYTGSTNDEFRKRHDWNSLLSHRYEELRVGRFTEDYYPHADDLVKYLQAFASTLELKIQYNTRVLSVERPAVGKPTKLTGRPPFVLTVDGTAGHTTQYSCAVFVSAAGFSNVQVPEKNGHLMETYQTVPADPKNFTNQNVLIIGKGNSAFEIVDMLTHEASLVHVVSRFPVRLSFFTHYVGDVRAVNNKLLDHYQLKSLDAMIEADANDGFHVQPIVGADGRKAFRAYVTEEDGYVPANVTTEGTPSHHPMRKDYHRVISCMGWNTSRAHYTSTVEPRFGTKYPLLNTDYESVNVRDHFFAGALMHSRDWRRSSGGFIHGFRYLVQALHRVMEQRYHSVPWPHTTISASALSLSRAILDRINSASSMYQMFRIIGDVIVLPSSNSTCTGGSCRASSSTAVYYKDVLLQRVHEYPFAASGARVLVVSMDYGEGFHGEQVLQQDRAVSDAAFSHRSNFLHPIIKEYMLEPKTSATPIHQLPIVSEHHVLEDFVTEWTIDEVHIEPLTQYLTRVVAGEKMPQKIYVDMEFEETMARENMSGAELRGYLNHLMTIAGSVAFRDPALTVDLVNALVKAQSRFDGSEHVNTAAMEVWASQQVAQVGQLRSATKMLAHATKVLQNAYKGIPPELVDDSLEPLRQAHARVDELVQTKQRELR